MRQFLILCVLVMCACANENFDDDTQQVQQYPKSVKGGHAGGFQYNPGANLVSLFGNQTQQGQGQGYWGQAQQGQQGQQGSWSQTQQGQQSQQGSWSQTQQGQQSQQDSWSQQHQGQQGNLNQAQQGQGNWNQAQQGQGNWNQAQQGQQGNWNQAQQNQYGFQNHTQGQQGQGYWRQNLTESVDLEAGVCYIEVPTVRLVKDPSHVPAGNGSRPDLSRIRSCCNGYVRNIHNFRKCDPVCSHDCVNALCTAPETCTCFPDHVKNLAGFCVPTCPIGCQNGHCDGSRCLCKEGFKLDPASKYCVPDCKGNCGGIGNCTAPNTCECKSGYQTTADGSCRPSCDKCTNGDCVAPNDCRCHQGYAKDHQGACASQCGAGYKTTPQGCKPVCTSCVHGECVAPNSCRCNQGYAIHQGQCLAQCSPDCGPSSRCVSPNVCDPPLQVVPNQIYQPSNQSQPLYPQNQNANQPRGDVPQCSQTCLNGVCAEGNRCNCNPGYVLDKDDPTGTRCLPHCPGGCPNGTCSAPSFCICNMGYVKDHSVKGRPSCVKRVRRSADLEEPIDIAKLLTFEIDDTDV